MAVCLFHCTYRCSQSSFPTLVVPEPTIRHQQAQSANTGAVVRPHGLLCRSYICLHHDAKIFLATTIVNCFLHVHGCPSGQCSDRYFGLKGVVSRLWASGTPVYRLDVKSFTQVGRARHRIRRGSVVEISNQVDTHCRRELLVKSHVAFDNNTTTDFACSIGTRVRVDVEGKGSIIGRRK